MKFATALAPASTGPGIHLLLERGDGSVDGRKQRGLADMLPQAEVRKLLAQGTIGARDLEGNALEAQLLDQPGERICPCDVDVGDRLGVQQEPAHRAWAGGDKTAHQVYGMLGVREQERAGAG